VIIIGVIYLYRVSNQQKTSPISWKILPKTGCLKCLISYDTIGWAELSDSHRIRPYRNTEPVVKLLTLLVFVVLEICLKIHNLARAIAYKLVGMYDQETE